MKGKKGEKGRRRGRHREREIRERTVFREDVSFPKKYDCDQIL